MMAEGKEVVNLELKLCEDVLARELEAPSVTMKAQMDV